MAYSSLNITEVGHYEFEECHVRNTNPETTANDIYADGIIVGLVGTDLPMKEDMEQLPFHDSLFRFYFYYRMEQIKQSVILLQNMPMFQSLASDDSKDDIKQTILNSEGVDMTEKTESQRGDEKGNWRIDVYTTDGEVFGVDTQGMTIDMTKGATGAVFCPSATFETETPGIPSGVDLN